MQKWHSLIARSMNSVVFLFFNIRYILNTLRGLTMKQEYSENKFKSTARCEHEIQFPTFFFTSCLPKIEIGIKENIIKNHKPSLCDEFNPF